MYAWATPEHHNRPWYSNVSLKMENIPNDNKIMFDQL